MVPQQQTVSYSNVTTQRIDYHSYYTTQSVYYGWIIPDEHAKITRTSEKLKHESIKDINNVDIDEVLTKTKLIIEKLNVIL